MAELLSHAGCLEKAIELERRAELEPDSGRNYLYMAKAWRRLAAQSEWQDKLLTTIDRELAPLGGREVSTGPDPLLRTVAPGLITFQHSKTSGHFVFTSPELPGWTYIGRSRELTGKKVIASWRKYLADQHDLGAGVRAALLALIPLEGV